MQESQKLTYLWWLALQLTRLVHCAVVGRRYDGSAEGLLVGTAALAAVLLVAGPATRAVAAAVGAAVLVVGWAAAGAEG